MPLKHLPDHIQFDPVRLAKSNLFETPRFFCDVYCLAPGQEQAPHTHGGNDKVYHVIEGEVVFRDGAEELPGRPGDTLWCAAGKVHGVRNPGPGNAVLLVFMAPHPRPERF